MIGLLIRRRRRSRAGAPGASPSGLSVTRIRAIVRKELREYRRNRQIVASMVIFPAVFLAQPAIQVFALPASQAATLRHSDALIYLLAIPALVPSALAATSIAGERQQGTLEPVLTTPIRREELLIGKALAVLLPVLAVSYGVVGLFLAAVELFAAPATASAFARGPVLLAQLLFTPLVATWSIWVGVAISSRLNDTRAAYQFTLLSGLVTVAISSLIAFNVIHATLRLTLLLGVLLLIADLLGWRIVRPLLDRERLIAGTRS